MRAFDDQSLGILFERVRDLTARRLLKWDAVTEYKFATEFGQTELLLSSIDQDDRHPYRLQVSRDGVGVERIESDISGGALLPTWENEQLDQLYEVVKREALGFERQVRAVFDDLTRIEEPPPPDADDVPF